MAQHGSKWVKMVLNGTQWCKMVQNGATWSKIVPNYLEYFKIVQNCFKIVHTHSILARKLLRDFQPWLLVLIVISSWWWTLFSGVRVQLDGALGISCWILLVAPSALFKWFSSRGTMMTGAPFLEILQNLDWGSSLWFLIFSLCCSIMFSTGRVSN